MGDTTIGTNIVTDGSTEYELMKALLDGIASLFRDRRNGEYAKNLKVLAAHLDNGGKLEYKLVENKYVKEFEQALKDFNIPYILMPNENGETAIATRDTDREQFLEIQQRIFSRYTDYWKEQAVDNIIENVQADPEYRHVKIPVLTFEENEMRLIAAQKLYGNGVVTGYKDNKTVVHPSSVYNKGGDLIDAQLDMAMEQAKGDGIKGYDLLTIRKAQAKYDQETLTAFCKAFKEKRSIALWDAGGRSKVGLSINRNGDIELCTPKQGHDGFSGEESLNRVIIARAGDSINETELFGMLSKHAGQIYNMVCCTIAERNNILAGERDIVKCNRPRYAQHSAEQVIHDDIRGGLQAALDAVKAEAYQTVENSASHKKNVSKEAKAHRKEDTIIQILTDRNHPMLQRWLSTEVTIQGDGQSVLTRADKEAMIDKIIEHFKDNHENSRDEMRIDTYSATQLKDLFKNKDKETRDKAQERDYDSPEQDNV